MIYSIVSKAINKEICSLCYSKKNTEEIKASAMTIGTTTLYLCNNCIKRLFQRNKRIEVSEPTDPFKNIWTYEYVIDKIFNDLIENRYDSNINQNKYIAQIAEKFWYFRLKSNKVFFEIHYQDLENETILLIEKLTQDCKTTDEKYEKLNGIMTEVIAGIAKQAEPLILSQTRDRNEEWLKRSVSEVREFVSFRWKLMNGDVQSV